MFRDRFSLKKSGHASLHTTYTNFTLPSSDFRRGECGRQVVERTEKVFTRAASSLRNETGGSWKGAVGSQNYGETLNQLYYSFINKSE